MSRRIARLSIALWCIPALVWAGVSPGTSFFRCGHDGQVRAVCCCTGKPANGATGTSDGCCCTIETYGRSELTSQSGPDTIAKPIASAMPPVATIAVGSHSQEPRVRPIEIHDRGRPSILLIDRSFRI